MGANERAFERKKIVHIYCPVDQHAKILLLLVNVAGFGQHWAIGLSFDSAVLDAHAHML